MKHTRLLLYGSYKGLYKPRFVPPVGAQTWHAMASLVMLLSPRCWIVRLTLEYRKLDSKIWHYLVLQNRHLLNSLRQSRHVISRTTRGFRRLSTRRQEEQ